MATDPKFFCLWATTLAFLDSPSMFFRQKSWGDQVTIYTFDNLTLALVVITDSLWFLGLGPKKTTLLRTPLSKSVWAEPPKLSRWGACYRLKANGEIKKRFKVKKSSVVRSSTCPQYSQSFHFKLQVLIMLMILTLTADSADVGTDADGTDTGWHWTAIDTGS